MRKLYLIIPIILLIYLSCEDKREEDTTPPTVTITSPQTNSTVSEIVTITCMSSDNEGVEKVELWINGVSNGLIDETEPYSFEWNTQLIENGSYTIIIRSYDINQNVTDSSPIILNVENSLNTQVSVKSVTYNLDEMTIEWTIPTISNFKDYKVLYSNSEYGIKDTLTTYTDITISSHVLTNFDPTIENWFWIQLTNSFGMKTIGDGLSNTIDSPPSPIILNQILYDDGFQITWSQSNDNDFKSYKLYESISVDMGNQTLIFESTDREDTNYVVTGVDEDRYYQIIVEDIWGLESSSNIEMGSSNIQLWGISYSILNTTELNLGNTGLTGSIPSELWKLTNLEIIYLYDNNLSGSIPSDISNLTNLRELYLHENDFTGSIPLEIGGLTNLTSLYLNDNNLSGSIPSVIGNLESIEKLKLNKNDFTGSIPLEIGNLTNLTSLYLNDNNLSGSIPSEIGGLTNLSQLFLHDNQLTNNIPDNFCDLNINWNSNTYFNISENQLCPPYPSCIEDYVGTQDTSGCN